MLCLKDGIYKLYLIRKEYHADNHAFNVQAFYL